MRHGFRTALGLLRIYSCVEETAPCTWEARKDSDMLIILTDCGGPLEALLLAKVVLFRDIMNNTI